MEQLVARQAHNLEVVRSSRASATNIGVTCWTSVSYTDCLFIYVFDNNATKMALLVRADGLYDTTDQSVSSFSRVARYTPSLTYTLITKIASK